ncbi:hypothetical protein [Nonomuraea fuscirosea]|nr:hypothetical protein [Nonomuraea fuscirosea]
MNEQVQHAMVHMPWRRLKHLQVDIRPFFAGKMHNFMNRQGLLA